MSKLDLLDKNIRFLVVDDFPTMRMMIRQCLKQIGFGNVVEAEDGNVALEQLKRNHFACVISDWNMPNRSGLDLLQIIRASGDWAKMPFLMVTAQAERTKVIEAVKAGASNYIVKPVCADDLQQKLEAIFTKQPPLPAPEKKTAAAAAPPQTS